MWWHIDLHGALHRNKSIWISDGIRKKNRIFTLNATVGNRFALKDWTIELQTDYSGKNCLGQYVIEPVWRIRGGIGKSLWDKRGYLLLSADDLFSTVRERMSGQILNRQYDTCDIGSRQITLSFTIRLVKGKTIRNDKKNGFDELKRIDTN